MDSYQQGLRDEASVKTWLELMGYVVTPSTETENIEDDIDCWVDLDSPVPGLPGAIAISIKTQHRGIYSGNICFELMVCHMNEWKQGWYYTSKAEVILIWVGNTIYRVTDKPPVYLMTNTNLSNKAKRSQDKIGHSHKDAKLGIISIKKMLELGYMTEFGTLPYANRPSTEDKIPCIKDRPILLLGVLPRPSDAPDRTR